MACEPWSTEYQVFEYLGVGHRTNGIEGDRQNHGDLVVDSVGSPCPSSFPLCLTESSIAGADHPHAWEAQTPARHPRFASMTFIKLICAPVKTLSYIKIRIAKSAIIDLSGKNTFGDKTHAVLFFTNLA